MKKLTVRRYRQTSPKSGPWAYQARRCSAARAVRDAKSTVLGDGSLCRRHLRRLRNRRVCRLKVVEIRLQRQRRHEILARVPLHPDMAEVAKAGGVEAKRLETSTCPTCSDPRLGNSLVIGGRHFLKT
jgi:hypothetical protein